ncbi:hypothetical protein EON66_01135 [archaeon]|nr:MAG: hypothetical protein EON66_01135 [archaeon]
MAPVSFPMWTRVPVWVCAVSAMRAAMEKLIEEFDPSTTTSVFQTEEQTRSSDEYFLESGVCGACACWCPAWVVRACVLPVRPQRFSTSGMQRPRRSRAVQDKVRFFYEKSALNDKNVLVVDKHVAINKVGHNLHEMVRGRTLHGCGPAIRVPISSTHTHTATVRTLTQAPSPCRCQHFMTCRLIHAWQGV